MSEYDNQRFEAGLQALRPASPPPALMERLRTARPAHLVECNSGSVETGFAFFRGWWRWLAPATALAVLGLAVWRFGLITTHPGPTHIAQAAPEPIKADEVQIDHELVSTFDAVTPLPSGEPVRFHCRQWLDQVVLRDSARGVVIERRSPRVEVVSVSFDTF